MKTVFFIIAIACLTLLAESFLSGLLIWFLKPKGTFSITVLPIDENSGDVEGIIRWLMFKAEMEKKDCENTLLIIDNGASNENMQKAELICRNKSRCRICKSEELLSILKGNSVCKVIELVLY